MDRVELLMTCSRRHLPHLLLGMSSALDPWCVQVTVKLCGPLELFSESSPALQGTSQSHFVMLQSEDRVTEMSVVIFVQSTDPWERTFHLTTIWLIENTSVHLLGGHCALTLTANTMRFVLKTLLLILILVVIMKNWKQQKCLSKGAWVNKMWNSYIILWYGL